MTMPVNKVVYGGKTVIDVTSDTVTPETLALGVTAHNKSGTPIVGTLETDLTGGLSGTKEITVKSSLVDGVYVLKYEDEDGTVKEAGSVIIGKGYNNLFDASKATLNKRWSNSGGGFTSTLSGYVASYYIPISALSQDSSNPTILRFRGASFAGNAAIVFYNSSKATLQASDAASNGTGVGPGFETSSVDENGDTCINLGWKNGSFHSAFATAAYFRIGLRVNASGTAITTADIQDIIITVDELIRD